MPESGITWWQAVLLGVLQGITEFLPVSSSGHLVLAQQWLPIFPEESASALFFDGLLHLGTLFSVLLYFWQYQSRKAGQSDNETTSIVAGTCAEASGPSVTHEISWLRWFWLLCWASAPAAVAVLVFPDWIRDSFVSVPMVIVDFLVLGALLWLTDRLPAGQIGPTQITWYHALLIGIAQMLSALFRGLSRSGMTISVALLLGLERTWSVRLSFALAIIANLGLASLGCYHAVQSGSASSWLTPSFLANAALGTLSSAIVGYATIFPLLRLVRRCRLRWFSIYLWTVGLVSGSLYLLLR